MVTTLLLSNGILMMQSNSTGVTSIYNVNTSMMGVTSGIPLNQTFNFFFIYNAYYVLQSTGLVKLIYNSTLVTLLVNGVMSILPYNTYRLYLGTSINAFYIPGKASIYYGGPCPGQATYTGGTCVSYNCTVANCSSCAIQASLCSTCKAGYLLSNNMCTYDNSTNSSNVSNSNGTTTTPNATNININNNNQAVADLSYNFEA